MTHVKILIRAEDTSLLLFQHRDEKPGIANPGLWTMIGGATEGDEEPEDAALRAVEEETGLRLANVKYVGTCTIIAQYKDGRAPASSDLRTYIGTVPMQTKANLSKSTELRWMTLEEFAALPAPEGMNAFLTKYADLIMNRVEPPSDSENE